MIFLFVIFLPTLFLCCFLLPFPRPLLIKIAPLTTIPSLLLSIYFPPEAPNAIPGFMIETLMGLDVTGKVFLFFTSFIWLISGIYAIAYLSKEKHKDSFFTFYLLSLTGNIGLILAHDLISFYLFFAWMGFSAYGLVVHTGTASTRNAGKVYISLVVIGELLIFLCFIMAANGSGSLSFSDASANIALSPSSNIIFILAFLGFGIKAGALPLHVWLPLAHPAAPIPASAVLSACMIKAGLLGWIRLLPFGYMNFAHWGYFMVAAGLIAAFYAVFVGLTQKKIKTILAYSSISQMGIMTIIAGAAFTSAELWPSLSVVLLIYACFHAFVKAALFLSVGTANMLPPSLIARCWHRTALFLPALALAGSPFTFGFIAKTWVKKHAITPMQATTEMAFLLDASSIATALLMVRFLLFTWPKSGEEKPLKTGMYSSWTAMVILILFSPLLILFPTIRDIVGNYSFIPYKLYELFPILIAAIISLVAIRKCWKIPFSLPEGDLLVVYLKILDSFKEKISSLTHSVVKKKEKIFATFFRYKWPQNLKFTYIDQALENWSFLGSFFLALFIAFFLLQTFVKTPSTPQITTKESQLLKQSQMIRS